FISEFLKFTYATIHLRELLEFFGFLNFLPFYYSLFMNICKQQAEPVGVAMAVLGSDGSLGVAIAVLGWRFSLNSSSKQNKPFKNWLTVRKKMLLF
ncbi:MAG: hypothetical protein AB4426_28750, partial [Xenococcaceae cyanobacterium]